MFQNLNLDVKEKLKTHNYCRNPQPLKESSPWCYVGRGQREYCDIPPCGNIGTSYHKHIYNVISFPVNYIQNAL